jgi:hypothetical protein
LRRRRRLPGSRRRLRARSRIGTSTGIEQQQEWQTNIEKPPRTKSLRNLPAKKTGAQIRSSRRDRASGRGSGRHHEPLPRRLREMRLASKPALRFVTPFRLGEPRFKTLELCYALLDLPIGRRSLGTAALLEQLKESPVLLLKRLGFPIGRNDGFFADGGEWLRQAHCTEPYCPAHRAIICRHTNRNGEHRSRC